MDSTTQVKEIFSRAVELPSNQRDDFLRRECGSDKDLRREVETLLSAHEEAADRLALLDEPFADPLLHMVGRTIDHFRVSEKIGAGGMGVVYAARDDRLDRMVALKFLSRKFGDNTTTKERFRHEARSAAAIEHPNICTVYDVGETSTGELYIVMALCDGRSLKELIARGPVAAPEAIRVGLQVAEALQRVHEKGILHRDIKPSNIMLDRDGLVKILDFGIAKLKSGSDLTSTAGTLGTVSYMSPEQISGKDVDHRTDVWSLGVVLYEMLAGHRPFEAPYQQAVIYSILNEDPPSLIDLESHIPEDVAAVVAKCLEKDAANRFESAAELLMALHRVETTDAGPMSAEHSDPAKSQDESLKADEAPLAADASTPKLFICYKAGIEPDESVARGLHDLLATDNEVFLDTQTRVGRRWVERMESALAGSDYVIALLSEESVRSEMVLGQIEAARRLNDRRGNPVILPVRLSYSEPFEYPLRAYLDGLNCLAKDRATDPANLADQLRQALVSGEILPSAEPAKVEAKADTGPVPRPLPTAQPGSLETPEGTMDSQSHFYVTRAEDQVAMEAIERGAVTITIKGPRQMGKSSLLIRTMALASSSGKHVVFLDFQLFDHHALSDAATFFRQFCSWITDELDLEDRVDEYWSRPLGHSQLCTRYVGRHVLKSVDAPVVLAMDEVERVFDTDFRSDFFSMLRSWHNDRAVKPVWRQLDLALVTSTEPYQLIENLNQSPFNVGEVIELTDFTDEQVAELNTRHNSPLSEAELAELLSLVGGHPYLVRRALYLVASARIASGDLLRSAPNERGPFGDHLRNHLFRLHEKEELVAGMREVLSRRECRDEAVFWRLRGAGLVRRANGDVVPRCLVYEKFFGEHLHA